MEIINCICILPWKMEKPTTKKEPCGEMCVYASGTELQLLVEELNTNKLTDLGCLAQRN